MHMKRTSTPIGTGLTALTKLKSVSTSSFPKFKCASVIALSLAEPASAAEINLCWRGASGYTMTGRMSVSDTAMFQAVVTEADVTRFKISGYFKGRLLGTWDSGSRDTNTTWHLRFDPVGMTFLTGGNFPSTASQGWNADGTSQNCGKPGFGFNSGNFAQDICVNGAWIEDSGIAPDTPLLATLNPVSPDCSNTAAVSKR